MILAPSIGNLHGSYLNPPNFRLEMWVRPCELSKHFLISLISVRELRKTLGDGIPICLHGTDELPDELFKECIKNGVSKVSLSQRTGGTQLTLIGSTVDQRQ